MMTGDDGQSHEARLDHVWSEAVYVVWADHGTPVEVEARASTSGVAVALDIISPYGDVVGDEAADDVPDSADEGDGAGAEASGDAGRMATTSFTVDADGPFFVVVTADPGGAVDVRANVLLSPLMDPDDGANLLPTPASPGTLPEAAMDYPGDVDAFALTLEQGQTARVTVETLNFSPEIIVDHLARPDLVPAALDTSVPSALGLAARAEFTSREATTYWVIVRDLDGIGTGGYFIRVEVDPPFGGTPER